MPHACNDEAVIPVSQTPKAIRVKRNGTTLADEFATEILMGINFIFENF